MNKAIALKTCKKLSQIDFALIEIYLSVKWQIKSAKSIDELKIIVNWFEKLHDRAIERLR